MGALCRLAEDVREAAPLFTDNGRLRVFDLGLAAQMAARHARRALPDSPTVFEVDRGLVTEGRPRLALVALRGLARYAHILGVERVRVSRRGRATFALRLEGAVPEIGDILERMRMPRRLADDVLGWELGVCLWTACEAARRHGGSLELEAATERSATFVLDLGENYVEWA